jgi:hypothetical protein
MRSPALYTAAHWYCCRTKSRAEFARQNAPSVVSAVHWSDRSSRQPVIAARALLLRCALRAPAAMSQLMLPAVRRGKRGRLLWQTGRRDRVKMMQNDGSCHLVCLNAVHCLCGRTRAASCGDNTLSVLTTAARTAGALTSPASLNSSVLNSLPWISPHHSPCLLQTTFPL